MTVTSFAQRTFFVGRDTELKEIAELLSNPFCRLLTLVGPGGIGKTRLAMEVAQQQNGSFVDGFSFVPLQSLDSYQLIAPSIAQCLQIHFGGSRDLIDQLLEYLSNKSLLLVLDNFEHLLEGVYLLSDILSHAPSTKILTTSRERLNLTEEWIYKLSGLSFPLSEAENEIETYNAVKLFILNARRVNHSFTLTQRKKSTISRICRLVEGMPLGIELAASWVHVLPCETIADELQRSLDILDNPIRNLLPRHRNMRAVIEPTWQRLQAEERTIYSKLAVFRGGFSLDAAIKIAGASHRNLLSFIEKSLLRLDESGQYSLHDILRQYAEEQLALFPQIERDTRDLHADYYLDFLREREQELVMLGAHTQAMEQMGSSLDNIRLAWKHGAERGWVETLTCAIEGYWGFHCMRGSCHEGAALFSETVAHLRENGNTSDETRQNLIALALAFEGFCTIEINFEHAQKLAEEAMVMAKEMSMSKAYFITLQLLINLTTNDTEQQERIEEALQLAKTTDYGWWLPKNLIDLGNLARKRGETELAEGYYYETLSTQHRHKNPVSTVSALQSLGLLKMRQHNYQAAKDFIEQALEIAYQLHYSAGWWWLHSGIADVALLSGDYTSAEIHYRNGLQISHEVGMPYGTVFCLNGLASVAIALRNIPLAQQHLTQALSIAQKLGGPGALLDVLTTGVNLLLAIGDKLPALRLAKFILTQAEAEELAKAKLEPLYEAINQDSVVIQGLTLERAVQELHHLLKNLALSNPAMLPTEALTKREIEVLTFIAEGLSNHEIADRLFVGVSTIKTHINHILSKLEVRNRTQAIIRARELHLL
jgi:predicted ATPase/DNA-binding CsgD family transcriptional regulator